jgi:putative ABC transport system permease protein
MKLFDLLKISNRNLFRSKLRTFLTVMAIFVGSFTLILTNGLGDGLKDYVEKQVKNIEGNSVLFVRRQMPKEGEEAAKPGAPREYKEAGQDEQGNVVDPNSLSVSTAQMESLVKELPDVKSFTPYYYTEGEYITLDGAKKYQVSLGMLSAGIRQKTEAGRTIDGEGQIMLPLSLAKTLDEDVSRLVGKTATIAYKAGQSGEIKTIPLKVVGVSTKGMMANFNAFVDTATARKIYEEQQSQSNEYNKFSSFTLNLNASDETQIKEIKSKLEEKGFSAETFADRQERTYDAIAILQIGLNLFASISLLAAAFGIINTLVIAVLERTKEVGLQKALGMGRGKVFLLFAFESILIGFWGAVTGIVAGVVIGLTANAYLARAYVDSFEGYRLFVFTPFAIVSVTLLVCAIAFLAGVLPAFRASRLNPIEALRYE